MRETPESLPYGRYLPDVYRFAFLMTGHADTAADVLRHTVGRATRGGIHGIRNPLQAKRWLFAEARTLCAHPPPATPRGDVPSTPVPGTLAPGVTASADVDLPTAAGDPPRQLARLFANVPETERTALILFYLFLFDPAELSELLEIKPAELGPLLLRGRTLLQRHGGLCETLFAAATAATEPGSAAASLPDTPAAPVGTEPLPDAA